MSIPELVREEDSERGKIASASA